MKPRLLLAAACYGLLALLAGLTLEQLPRIVVWLFLAALMVKSWIAAAQKPQ